MKINEYLSTIKKLKSTILRSRYKAAALANRELLILYFNVGKLILEKSEKGKWGDKTLDLLSADLQKELPGLKGFSATNIKRMRTFYNEWKDIFIIGPTPSDQLQKKVKKKAETIDNAIKYADSASIGPMASDQFIIQFLSISFSHHYELLIKTKSMNERQFYIASIASEFWSVEVLKMHLGNKLFKKRGKMPNNFNKTISNEKHRTKAILSFKDEYLLDFVNIEERGEEDERLVENEIVKNIKKFLLSLGADFAFIGNQYRMIIENEEYFIDLLFFNRKLQSLVAFDLKKGKFKPEYAGKMNFYLSALDELLKFPHEMPAIGIILCKEKNNRFVEFSFRDMNKSMGVATYKTSDQLPKKYKHVIPDAETLKRLMK